MKESWSETLWNEEIRRCEVVDFAEKVREARLRWCGYVTRRDEGELIREVLEYRQKKAEDGEDAMDGLCKRYKYQST
jgi:hypothetical protein